MIEPIFNEVSQTLSNALGGKFDYMDRQSQRRKDVDSSSFGDISNDLEYFDNEDTEDNSNNDDDNDERYNPTLPPIYPSVKRKPENRSMKSSR